MGQPARLIDGTPQLSGKSASSAAAAAAATAAAAG